MTKIKLLLSVVFISLSGFAQTSFGLKTGVNYSYQRMIVPNDAEMDLYPLFCASIFRETNLSQNTNFLIEVGLKQTGYKIRYSNDIVSASNKSYVNQLTISPGLTFNISEKVSFGLGSYIGYRLSDNNKFGTMSGVVGFPQDDLIEEFSYSYKKDLVQEEEFDYGMNFSINYFVNESIFISSAYFYGFKDHNNWREKNKDSKLGMVMNRSLMFSVGYLFR